MLKVDFLKNRKIIALIFVIFLLLIGQYNGIIYSKGDLFGLYSAPQDPSLKFNFKFTDSTPLLDIPTYLKETVNGLDSTGASVGDINRDGFEDVIFVTVNSMREGTINVQMNRNGQRYESDKLIENTIKSFKPRSKILSAMLVDLDNDGWEDLVVSYDIGCAGFYKNINGNFVTNEWRDVCSTEGDMAYVNLADINNDGYIDIYFTSLLKDRTNGFHANFIDNGSVGGKNILVINHGGKFFEDKTDEYGIIDFGVSWTAALADYNNDGFVDIIDINDLGYNQYFENINGKKFTNKTKELLKQEETSHSMSGEVADFDKDGFFGAYVTNVGFKTRLRYGYNALWKKSNEDGSFKNNARDMKIDSCGYSWGARSLEPSRNGELSLFVVTTPSRLNHRANFNSTVSVSSSIFNKLSEFSILRATKKIMNSAYKDNKNISYDEAKMQAADSVFFLSKTYDGQRNCFFTKVQDKYFDISENVGIKDVRNGKAIVETDYNNDGVADLLINNIDGSPIMYKGSYSGDNNWIGFKLKGNISNRDAIGAVVEVEFQKYKLKKQIFPTNGYQSLSTKRLLFGIDVNDKIKNITIKWPSGIIQKISDYTINKYNNINESP